MNWGIKDHYSCWKCLVFVSRGVLNLCASTEKAAITSDSTVFESVCYFGVEVRRVSKNNFKVTGYNEAYPSCHPPNESISSWSEIFSGFHVLKWKKEMIYHGGLSLSAEIQLGTRIRTERVFCKLDLHHARWPGIYDIEKRKHIQWV